MRKESINGSNPLILGVLFSEKKRKLGNGFEIWIIESVCPELEDNCVYVMDLNGSMSTGNVS